MYYVLDEESGYQSIDIIDACAGGGGGGLKRVIEATYLIHRGDTVFI